MDDHKDGQTVSRSGQSTKLGEWLINEQEHFTERMCCMQKSYNKWEHGKTKIYTLQTQHAKVMVMVQKLPTNQVWNGYNGN